MDLLSSYAVAVGVANFGLFKFSPFVTICQVLRVSLAVADIGLWTLRTLLTNHDPKPSSSIGPSCLKITNRSFYHLIPVLCNFSLPPDLCHLSFHFTPSIPGLHSRPYDLSTAHFLKKLETHRFHKSFPHGLYSPTGP